MAMDDEELGAVARLHVESVRNAFGIVVQLGYNGALDPHATRKLVQIILRDDPDRDAKARFVLAKCMAYCRPKRCKEWKRSR